MSLLDFTSTEYDLLWLLASNAVVSYRVKIFFERLRGIGMMVKTARLMYVFSHPSKKLVMIPKPKRIKTVRSKGLSVCQRKLT